MSHDFKNAPKRGGPILVDSLGKLIDHLDVNLELCLVPGLVSIATLHIEVAQ